MHSEATTAQKSTHEALPKKSPKEEKEEKDEKEKKLTIQKIVNAQSTVVQHSDGGSAIERTMDCAARMVLKHHDGTPEDIDGKIIGDEASGFARALSRGQFIAKSLNTYCDVSYIDPSASRSYQQHKIQQDTL